MGREKGDYRLKRAMNQSKWWFFHLISFWSLFSEAGGHVVDQFVLSLEKEGAAWRIGVMFDAAYAFPALRDDEESPAPERSWLVGLGEKDHAALREGAEDYLREALSFRQGASGISFQVSFPDYRKSPPDFPRLLNGLAYVTVELSGKLRNDEPDGLEMVVSPEVSPNFVVELNEGQEGRFLVVSPGESTVLFDGTGERVGFLGLGFRHVLPDGLDHTLFIVALFLRDRRWRALLLQSLVFTLAHSVTLALAVSGVIPGSGWPGSFLIEPLIAFSIALLAFENLIPRKAVKKGRLAAVFLFGLIHGLGFAGSLGAILVEEDSIMIPLALSNLGVEVAQVLILALAWIFTMGWWRFQSYAMAQKVLSATIGLAGMWWTVERLLT